MFLERHLYLVAVTMCIVCSALADERWVWSKDGNRQERAYREDQVDQSIKQFDKYRSGALERREREPTTKRPSSGSAQHDDIDDYTDVEQNNLSTRNYSPYGGNGYNAGFNNYPENLSPGFGNGNSAPNGILVGPGGPTGIIGRPPQSFGGANGAFPLDGAGAGFPGQTQFGQGAGFNGGFNPGFQGGFPGQAGFPGAGPQAGLNPGIGQYPGGQYISAGGAGVPGQFGQYPGSQFPQYPGGQFPGAQYQGNQFPGGQYPSGQFPGAQFSGSQYPSGGPQYTEGYGLAYTQGYPANGGALPFNNFGNAYGQGFDAYDTKRKLQIEGKSAASVESRNLVDKRVDDKVGKKL